MITGAHAIIYSKDPDADRAFLRDVLGFPHVDVGGGWLIFGLPPAEVAVHPSDENDVHEFYLMCDDVTALVAAMKERRIASTPIQNQGWGLLTHVALPGGGKLGIYQPRHARPESALVPAPNGIEAHTARAPKPPARKPAAKKPTKSTAKTKPAAKKPVQSTAKKPAAKKPAKSTAKKPTKSIAKKPARRS